MFDEMQDQNVRTTEDYWAILRRRRWLILISAFICWALVWGVGWLLPSSYESDAVILVQQQQVSPNLVQPNVTVSVAAQLESIEQQVLSRTRLQNIIDRFHLYSHRHTLLAFFEAGDPVEQMRTKDIQIKLVEAPGKNNQGELTAFDISYSAPNPELAQAVNGELTDLFIQENMNTQQQFSQTTTSFLQNELADARVKLQEQEAKVKSFKAQHVGQLPDQLQGNLQILGGLQSQMENNEHALSAARQQRLYLQSIVQQFDSAQSELGTNDSAVSPDTLDNQLKTLEMQLTQMRSQYTDNYPDVIALKEQIEKTKQQKKDAEDQAAAARKANDKADTTIPDSSAIEVRNGAPTPMMQVQSQLKGNQLEIQSLLADQKKIQGQIAAYQARLNTSPLVEQQLDEISRGYTESSKNYDDLQQKLQDSQLASNLQQNQQGEQFRIISPANLPPKPSAPNHLLISLGGLAFGVIVGLGLAALLEFADARIRKETDLGGIVTARVLVGIPKMITPMEEQRRATLRWIERGAAVAMLILVGAGNIYTFYRG